LIRLVMYVCLSVLVFAAPAAAQGARSSWGVSGTFVPEWRVPSALEVIAALHFSEDDLSIEDQNLKGPELRIGIVRGRAEAGDWGVSFVRRGFDEVATTSIGGGGCTGTTQGGTFVLQCESLSSEMARRDVVLNGIEVHKYIPFVTISDRVQIGLNVAGGFGSVSGQVDLASFRATATCTFPPGVLPGMNTDFDAEFPECVGATISNLVRTPTGSSTDDISRFLKSDSSLLPIGRVEIGAGVIVSPRFKVRVHGGLNYPGVNNVSITGVYFFGG
jgi:hypothetical protein